MKKVLSILIVAVLLVGGVFLLTGCGNAENKDTSNAGESGISAKSWPAGVSYVPSIEYTGKGKIVYTKESSSGDEYSIYIKGATLDSANEYIDKLYNNNYTIMNMFDDEGKHLEKPKSNSSYKLGFDSPDEKIGAMVIIHDGNPKVSGIEYNLVITFANTDY